MQHYNDLICHITINLIKKVEDQGVQLNRILRLLKEEEMALYKRCNLNESRSSNYRPKFIYNPFKNAIESSNAALKRNKQFEVITISVILLKSFSIFRY